MCIHIYIYSVLACGSLRCHLSLLAMQAFHGGKLALHACIDLWRQGDVPTCFKHFLLVVCREHGNILPI